MILYYTIVKNTKIMLNNFEDNNISQMLLQIYFFAHFSPLSPPISAKKIRGVTPASAPPPPEYAPFAKWLKCIHPPFGICLMVLILDGNSEIGAHVSSNNCVISSL